MGLLLLILLILLLVGGRTPLQPPSWGTVLESLHRQSAVEHRQPCKNRITGEPRCVDATASLWISAAGGARYG